MKNPFLEKFRPYIPASVTNLRELTPVPLIVGTLLGIVFGASSLYLVLKVGLTVSASIPVAVISITLFRLLSKMGARDATILEHNVVQTAGSAGESIAFGVGVTMPAILILGFDLDVWRVTLVAVLGGLLGILMMIPLRRALIRDQHGILKYPEGTACAQVLMAGASKESREASHVGDTESAGDSATHGGKIISIGFGLGFLFNTLMLVFKAWKETPTKVFGRPFEGGSISNENNPALLGVGYIIGPRIAGVMFAGGALAYLVLIPLIKFFGSGLTEALAPGTVPISAMGIQGKNSVQADYILYIGAGAVAAGGVISLFRSLPVIWNGMKGGLADLRKGSDAKEGEALPRTDQDISIKFVIGGILALIVIITFVPALKMNLLGAILIIVFGFLFVTVSSRLTGEIGSSSNPISGMTVATLLFTCLVFLIVGWTAPDPYFVTALSIGGIVCIAASNGGTTSQDLKTGFWVGGTPKKQQIAILVGATASALVLGPILLALNNSGTVYAGPTTFARVKDKEVIVDAANLPVYTGEFKPPEAGEYKVLENKVLEGQKEPAVKDIPAGTFLTDAAGKVMYKVQQNFPKGAVVPPGTEVGPAETLSGSQGDGGTYRGWHKTDSEGGIQPGKYLVATSGEIKYLVDQGVNGTITEKADGGEVTKYVAPKATLMSYIIKGILSQELPWGLVILGMMIAITLELAGIPSLAFAVGLYLPIAISAPIFVGGTVRWLVDKVIFKKLQDKNLTEEEMIAETDKSSGVLLASGYIAGGALAGILVAFSAEFLSGTVDGFTRWSETYNPFFGGDHSNWLGLIPFLGLAALLYFVGREMVLKNKKSE
jgi:putative OPT family oligopeptide transporter